MSAGASSCIGFRGALHLAAGALRSEFASQGSELAENRSNRYSAPR